MQHAGGVGATAGRDGCPRAADDQLQDLLVPTDDVSVRASLPIVQPVGGRWFP